MIENNGQIVIPDELVIGKIYLIRGNKVMLDKDLSELYGVTTGNLNKAVKRNITRFPYDFMFQLTKEEFNELIFQIGISSWGGTRKLPYAFTEQGVAMLSGVLHSVRAIKVNIQIMRIFSRMRTMVEAHKEILLKLEQLAKKDIEQDERIMLIFEYLKQLEQIKQEELEKGERTIIKGFQSIKAE
jgi:ORF6N domain